MGMTEKEMDEMSENELGILLARVKAALEQKKKENGKVRIRIETEENFDPRPHGHAYCAFLRRDDSGKIEREWVNNANTIYDSKHRCYHRVWDFEATEGDIIEARTAASWKNEYREYYTVRDGQQVEIEKEEAFNTLLNEECEKV